jgi:pimeloyl-ACP methyl ester carboxylesterase
MAPLCVFDEPEKKLPVILVVQEMYRGNEHLPVAGLSYFYQTCEIAAQGECIVLFFALEHPDDNDLFADILEDAAGLYPVDKTRVYITGHSHDGLFAYEFAYRHPDIITAVATLGDPCGLTYFGDPKMCIKDEQIEVLKNIDIPVINMLGTNEGGAMVPTPGTKDFEDFAIAWQRRLKASRCPMKTAEDIKLAQSSEDYATRKLGLPVDRTSVIWSHGFEHYIGEVKNIDGKYHLSLFISQNMPHTTTPFMLDMAWSFLRRFARDPKTKKIIELY